MRPSCEHAWVPVVPKRDRCGIWGWLSILIADRLRARHTLVEALQDGMTRLPIVSWLGDGGGRVDTCGATEAGRPTFNETSNNNTWGSERLSSTISTSRPHYPEQRGFPTKMHALGSISMRLVCGMAISTWPLCPELHQSNTAGGASVSSAKAMQVALLCIPFH